MHHIICDAWSVAIFSYEVATVYNTLLKNSTSSEVVGLPEIRPVTVRLAQAALEKNINIEESCHCTNFDEIPDISFWTAEMEGNEPFIELPMDRPRPSSRTEAGDSFSFELPKSCVQAMHEYHDFAAHVFSPPLHYFD